MLNRWLLLDPNGKVKIAELLIEDKTKNQWEYKCLFPYKSTIICVGSHPRFDSNHIILAGTTKSVSKVLDKYFCLTCTEKELNDKKRNSKLTGTNGIGFRISLDESVYVTTFNNLGVDGNFYVLDADNVYIVDKSIDIKDYVFIGEDGLLTFFKKHGITDTRGYCCSASDIGYYVGDNGSIFSTNIEGYVSGDTIVKDNINRRIIQFENFLNYEDQLQNRSDSGKSRTVQGKCGICGRKKQITITGGHISAKAVTCRC